MALLPLQDLAQKCGLSGGSAQELDVSVLSPHLPGRALTRRPAACAQGQLQDQHPLCAHSHLL